MKRFHLAISTHDLDASVAEYSRRLDCDPEIVVPNEYALWRCGALNLSVRVDLATSPGTLRHLGWEDPGAPAFSQDTDTNGIVWEIFNAAQQASEIQQQWPETEDYWPNEKRDV
mgnify:CR=1 FL=1